MATKTRGSTTVPCGINAGAGLIGRERLARRHRGGQHQSARDTETLENAAARYFFDLDADFHAAKPVGTRDDVHDQTPVEAR